MQVDWIYPDVKETIKQAVERFHMIPQDVRTGGTFSEVYLLNSIVCPRRLCARRPSKSAVDFVEVKAGAAYHPRVVRVFAFVSVSTVAR